MDCLDVLCRPVSSLLTSSSPTLRTHVCFSPDVVPASAGTVEDVSTDEEDGVPDGEADDASLGPEDVELDAGPLVDWVDSLEVPVLALVGTVPAASPAAPLPVV